MISEETFASKSDRRYYERVTPQGKNMLPLLRVLRSWFIDAPHTCKFHVGDGHTVLIPSSVLIAFGVHILDTAYHMRLSAMSKMLHWTVQVAYLAFASGNCDQCAKCGARSSQSDRLTTCSRCHVAHYCSKACQRSDWSKHKGHCFDLEEDLALTYAPLSGAGHRSGVSWNPFAGGVVPGLTTHTICCSAWTMVRKQEETHAW